MKIELTALEARVIGSLIEKQITTPDQYPLSLNALLSACNQRSNRDPVMDLEEATVRQVLEDLARKHLVLERAGFGSRVPKYQHRLCNTEFGTLKLDAQELAIVCELLLRGPQTPGELRSRASRMAEFSEVSQVEAALERLAVREDGPLAARLAREPGRREARWIELFAQRGAAAAETLESGSAPETSFPASRQEERLTRLEEEVRAVRAELAELRQRLAGRSPGGG
jgi:uncharacterized protein YceH (UPF0502 family)